MAHDELYIPPVLDARRAWGVAESQITRAQSVMPGSLEGIARRMTPRSMPTVRPAADPCADFERAVREEGEFFAVARHAHESVERDTARFLAQPLSARRGT